jgi:hypothetical protein
MRQGEPTRAPGKRRGRGRDRARGLHALAYNLGKFHADAGDAQDGTAVVADQPAGEADQDRRQGREPRPLTWGGSAKTALPNKGRAAGSGTAETGAETSSP